MKSYQERLEEIALVLEIDGQFYRRYMRAKGDTFGMRRQIISTALWDMKRPSTVEDRDQLRRYFDERYEIPQLEPNKYSQYMSVLVDDDRTGNVYRYGYAPPAPAAQIEQQMIDFKQVVRKITQDVLELTEPFDPQPTEPDMIKITTQTLFNGKNILDLSDDQLFEAIAAAEAEVAKLNEIKAKPKKLIAKIAEIEAGIAALVAHMDSKEKTSA